tara:strand:- start:608 stop:898 length:291 start_codon:yes stop_codon:yes gene_type:complete
MKLVKKILGRVFLAIGIIFSIKLIVLLYTTTVVTLFAEGRLWFPPIVVDLIFLTIENGSVAWVVTLVLPVLFIFGGFRLIETGKRKESNNQMERNP